MAHFAQAAATVPEPCMVFGTALRPFCLGHHLLFKRLGLPFCGNALADATDAEILIGIAICGQSYEETLNQFLDGSWQRVFENWKKELAKKFAARRFFIFKRNIAKDILSEGRALFLAYLEDGYQHCPVWKHQMEKGIHLSAPWELILKNGLVMGGYSPTEALNGYLPACWYDYYSVTELNAAAGCVDASKWRKVFYTEEDAKILPPLRKENK